MTGENVFNFGLISLPGANVCLKDTDGVVGGGGGGRHSWFADVLNMSMSPSLADIRSSLGVTGRPGVGVNVATTEQQVVRVHRVA